MKKLFSLLLAVVMLFSCVMALASCGQELAFGKEFKPAKDQVTVLFELNAKTIDVGVMDSIMAGYYMSQDTTYANALMIVPNLITLMLLAPEAVRLTKEYRKSGISDAGGG